MASPPNMTIALCTVLLLSFAAPPRELLRFQQPAYRATDQAAYDYDDDPMCMKAPEQELHLDQRDVLQSEEAETDR